MGVAAWGGKGDTAQPRSVSITCAHVQHSTVVSSLGFVPSHHTGTNKTPRVVKLLDPRRWCCLLAHGFLYSGESEVR